MKAQNILLTLVLTLIIGCTNAPNVDTEDEYLLAQQGFAEDDIRDIAINEYPGKVTYSEKTADNIWRMSINGAEGESIIAIDGTTGIIKSMTPDVAEGKCLPQAKVISISKERAQGDVVKAAISKPCGVWEIHTAYGDKVVVTKIDSTDGAIKGSSHYSR